MGLVPSSQTVYLFAAGNYSPIVIELMAAFPVRYTPRISRSRKEMRMRGTTIFIQKRSAIYVEDMVFYADVEPWDSGTC